MEKRIIKLENMKHKIMSRMRPKLIKSVYCDEVYRCLMLISKLISQQILSLKRKKETCHGQ